MLTGLDVRSKTASELLWKQGCTVFSMVQLRQKESPGVVEAGVFLVVQRLSSSVQSLADFAVPFMRLKVLLVARWSPLQVALNAEPYYFSSPRSVLLRQRFPGGLPTAALRPSLAPHMGEDTKSTIRIARG